jgi:hypothetical protein
MLVEVPAALGLPLNSVRRIDPEHVEYEGREEEDQASFGIDEEARRVEWGSGGHPGSADAGPAVVPQRREQPGAVAREDEVGDGELPVALAPPGSLIRARRDQYVAPAGVVHERRGRVREDGVCPAGVEVSEPPGLIARLPQEHLEQGSLSSISTVSSRAVSTSASTAQGSVCWSLGCKNRRSLSTADRREAALSSPRASTSLVALRNPRPASGQAHCCYRTRQQGEPVPGIRTAAQLRIAEPWGEPA